MGAMVPSISAMGVMDTSQERSTSPTSPDTASTSNPPRSTSTRPPTDLSSTDAHPLSTPSRDQDPSSVSMDLRPSSTSTAPPSTTAARPVISPSEDLSSATPSRDQTSRPSAPSSTSTPPSLTSRRVVPRPRDLQPSILALPSVRSTNPQMLSSGDLRPRPRSLDPSHGWVLTVHLLTSLFTDLRLPTRDNLLTPTFSHLRSISPRSLSTSPSTTLRDTGEEFDCSVSKILTPDAEPVSRSCQAPE